MLNLENIHAGILKDVTLSLREGCCTAICGPSGSGKTTLLNCIAGYQHYQGDIYYQGNILNKLPIWQRPCRYLNQRLYLFPWLNVMNNLRLAQYAAKIPRDKQHIIALLDKMNIAHLAKRYPHEISGGEQQRVALARAMISSPSLLLLDEPFSSLDWQTREQLWSQVNQLKRDGVTILLVTHEPKEAAALAEYHVAIENGNILQS
ncbi:MULTISPECIES: ATP-binding cassette domain-containing protein [Providencia]|nr:ATP-binding cassette domain-containing protein [Providencia sp. PROV259]HEM8290904.1 ATP-binding cassette domain-containing protein [Providencia stuartii]